MALIVTLSRIFTSCKFCERVASLANIQAVKLLDVSPQIQTTVRNGHFVDWKMIRDYKRRECVKQFNASRQRLNSLRKNNLLPREIQEMAHKDVAALPVDSNYIRLRSRCIMTSRPRGVLKKWKLSRIMWRHFADYNQMSGITRSCW